MTLNSMTGFGRSNGFDETVAWQWEVRSVNGRGLDIRLRLPSGMDSLEQDARNALARRFKRGSVTAQLTVKREGGRASISINEETLAKVLFAAARLQAETGAKPPTVDGLLALRGVLEVEETNDDDLLSPERRVTLLEGLDAAASELADARRSEGNRLETVLREHVEEIDRLTGDVAKNPARSPEAIRTRLADQVRRLMETGIGLDPDRLHQEAVLIATRADVEEALKRLASHTVAARELFASSDAVGRKLDFLSQEFNREANTLGSKSNATEVTRLGLALKAVIDQFREQVQNVE